MLIRKYIVALLLSLVLPVTGCQKPHGPDDAARPGVTGVTVEAIHPSMVEDYYEASGTVRAKTVSRISSRVMGAVTSIKVREGDRVRKGQVLLTIDDRDMREKVSAAEEAYNEALRALRSAEEQKALADKTYERYRKLHEERALSTQELDNMETRKKVAEYELERVTAMVNRTRAGLREARVYLGFTTVRSPIDGIVARKLTDTGSMATPGMPLLQLEDNSSYRIEVNVDERYLTRIETGMKARVHMASADRTIEGTVAEVVPTVQPATRTFLVKIDIADSSLRSGLYGKVRFVTGTKEATLLPSGAVVSKGQLTGVYVVDDERVVTYRLVRVGREYDGNVEVLSGISPGERVVVEGAVNAVDGGILEEVRQP